jgi:transcriptional regulator with XRE-family HTH domain
LSDQVRRAVDRFGLSRYRICKLARIDQATFSRFMADKVGLSLPTLDALASFLGLRIVADEPKAQG